MSNFKRYLACKGHQVPDPHCQFCLYATQDGTGFDMQKEVENLKRLVSDLDRKLSAYIISSAKKETKAKKK